MNDSVDGKRKNDDGAASLLARAKVIAVVGASPREGRPSNIVFGYLVEQGYTVIPVRPRVREILGRTSFDRLEDIPGHVDIVDVFRRPEACAEIARSAVAVGAGALWLQEGIINEEARRIAEDGGLAFVMDRCIKVVHQRSRHHGSV